MTIERLDKRIAASGARSRRDARALIRAGRVTVNGTVVREPEAKVVSCDEISVDGTPVPGAGRVVLMLHKPAGFVTSTSDPRERIVMELLPPEYRRLSPVGRLDKETEGLLLFTDDGALAHRLISPKSRVEKVYEVEHAGQAGEADVAAFARGLTLRDGTVCLPAALEPLGPGRSRVRLCEGRYHQVRRMMAARSMPVTGLRRVAEGALTLGGLPPGSYRLLDEAEIRLLETGKST